MVSRARRRLDRTSLSRSARRRGVDPPTRLVRFTRDLRVAAAGRIGMLWACSSSLRGMLLGD
jgi:hypothetical protein